jgi:hypothetical protein
MADTAPGTEKDLARRLAEEADFLRAVQGGTHRIARSFYALGGWSARTVIVRDEAPFSLVTPATFPPIDELGRRLIEGAGLIGTSVSGPFELARQDRPVSSGHWEVFRGDARRTENGVMTGDR